MHILGTWIYVFRGDPQKTMRRGLHLNMTSSLLIVYEMTVE